MFRHASQPGCLETPVTYLDVPRKHYKSDLISDPCYMWLGLDRIHALTLVRPYSLLIQFNTTSGLWGEALYNDFSVGDESSGYSLSIYGFTGKGVAGDAFKLTILHETLNGATFCAKDTCPEAINQCAADNKGAWWSREDTECVGTPHNGNNILCPQSESLTPCLDYVMWLIPNEISCCV
ncbi:fibrinogen C domain-containing protein 1-like [Haliotis cracherodii]|uniref:fibrinogen C domain-containing protein 1-like n=1 Tax=Haliotis cracherodii TaxID=6455 RepID=UPI0039E9EE7B